MYFWAFILSRFCLLSLNASVFLIGHHAVESGSKIINKKTIIIIISIIVIIIYFLILIIKIVLLYLLYFRKSFYWNMHYVYVKIDILNSHHSWIFVTTCNFWRTMLILLVFIEFFFTLHFRSPNETSLVLLPTHKSRPPYFWYLIYYFAHIWVDEVRTTFFL